nr:unnamed protein product [Spirometra erinaceieuropaei]
MSLVHPDTRIKSSNLSDNSTRPFLKEPGRSYCTRDSAQNAKCRPRPSMTKRKAAAASGGCRLTDLCPEDRERLADLVSHLSDVQSALEAANEQQLLQQSSVQAALGSKNVPLETTRLNPALIQNSPAQSLMLHDPSGSELHQLTCQRNTSSLPLVTSLETERSTFPPCLITPPNLPCSSYRLNQSLIGAQNVPSLAAAATNAIPARRWSNDPTSCHSNNHWGINGRLLVTPNMKYVTPTQYERQLSLLESELQNLRASLGGWTHGPHRLVTPDRHTSQADERQGMSYDGQKHMSSVNTQLSRPGGALSNQANGVSLQAESDKASLETERPAPAAPISKLPAETAADVLPFTVMDSKPEQLNAVGRACSVPVWEVLSDEEVESCTLRDSCKPKDAPLKLAAMTPAPGRPARGLPANHSPSLPSRQDLKTPKVLIDEAVQMGEQKSSSENAVQTDPTVPESSQRNSNAVTEDTAAPESLETQTSAYVSAATASTGAQSPSIPVPVGTASSDISAGRSTSPRPSDNVELKRLAAQRAARRLASSPPTSTFAAVSSKPRRLHLLSHRDSHRQAPNLHFRRQVQLEFGGRPQTKNVQTKSRKTALSRELEEGLYLSQILNNCKHTSSNCPSSRRAFGELGSLLSAEEEELFNELFFVN